MAGKIGCITNPKLLWNILLLRPDVEDFKTWLFCISKGSPFARVLTFYLNPFWYPVQGRRNHQDHQDWPWLVFESPFHKFSEEKKILKIGLKLAEIETKMHLMRGCILFSILANFSPIFKIFFSYESLWKELSKNKPRPWSRCFRRPWLVFLKFLPVMMKVTTNETFSCSNFLHRASSKNDD